VLEYLFVFGFAASSGPGPPPSRGDTTFGRTRPDEWSARHRDLYTKTHNIHNRQISMPPVGFEPTISADEPPLRPPNVRLRGEYFNKILRKQQN